jgi:hypothetical protein
MNVDCFDAYGIYRCDAATAQALLPDMKTN